MLNKILFFGNERLASGVTTTAPLLRGLIAANYKITGVVVAQADVQASRRERQLEIVQVAAEHQIPVFAPAKLRQAADELAALGAEIGVLAAYGKIVPQSIIDLFPHGIVNIHPSLLPRHRGPTPIESVILNGETETGVSLMSLASEMDAGPVYDQRRVTLNGNETKFELAETLSGLGRDMLLEALPGILDGSLQPVAQNNDQATYDSLLSKDLSAIDWHKSAEQLAREVRAYAGWPRSRATLAGHEVVITAAHRAANQYSQDSPSNPGVIQANRRELAVATGDGLLIIDTLLPAGKREMPGAAFIAGYLKV